MGVFTRLTDIINANLSAVLDRAEDPAKTIRLMIQEMEETLVEVRASAARLIADGKGLKRRRQQLQATIADWEGKAELAVSKGREDLARGALGEKARLQRMLEQLDEELGKLDEGLVRYEEDIQRLQQKLDEARTRQKAILARQQTLTHRLQVRRTVEDERIERAFARFEQMERRVDRLEGEVESFDLGKDGKEAGAKTPSLADELATLEGADSIEAELNALKAKVARRQPDPSGTP